MPQVTYTHMFVDDGQTLAITRTQRATAFSVESIQSAFVPATEASDLLFILDTLKSHEPAYVAHRAAALTLSMAFGYWSMFNHLNEMAATDTEVAEFERERRN